jgi:hypothetical protein
MVFSPHPNNGEAVEDDLQSDIIDPGRVCVVRHQERTLQQDGGNDESVHRSQVAHGRSDSPLRGRTGDRWVRAAAELRN